MRVLRVVLVIEDDVLLHQIPIGKIEIIIFMRSRMHRPTFMVFFSEKVGSRNYAGLCVTRTC